MSAGVRGRIGADDHGARVVRFEDEREAATISTPVLILPLDPASCAARETAVAKAQWAHVHGEAWGWETAGDINRDWYLAGARAVLAAVGAGAP